MEYSDSRGTKWNHVTLTESLANEINAFDLSSEKAKDDATYREGKRQYEHIKLNSKFVNVAYLDSVETHLNENGKKVFERYFKKYFEELKKGTKKK